MLFPHSISEISSLGYAEQLLQQNTKCPLLAHFYRCRLYITQIIVMSNVLSFCCLTKVKSCSKKPFSILPFKCSARLGACFPGIEQQYLNAIDFRPHWKVSLVRLIWIFSSGLLPLERITYSKPSQ